MRTQGAHRFQRVSIRPSSCGDSDKSAELGDIGFHARGEQELMVIGDTPELFVPPIAPLSRASLKRRQFGYAKKSLTAPVHPLLGCVCHSVALSRTAARRLWKNGQRKIEMGDMF